MQFYGLTKAEAKFLVLLLDLHLGYTRPKVGKDLQMARELKYYLENDHRRGE